MTKTDQSEGAQNGECFVAGETKFNEAETDNEQVETVPAFLEVAEQSKSGDLERSFSRKDRREHLNNTVATTDVKNVEIKTKKR